MRTESEVTEVRRLAQRGLNRSQIARATAIPRGTVRDWLLGRVPRGRPDPSGVPVIADESAYAYVLGLYLGDGMLVRFPRAWCLRIFCDTRYPRIVAEAAAAIRRLLPSNRVSRVHRTGMNCVVVQCYSTRWPCLLPQHGAGRKHTRPIFLAPWQTDLCSRYPRELVRGLLHSDGSRYINRIVAARRSYEYPTYAFTNESSDIRGILCEHLDQLGIAWRPAGRRNVSIARREAVAALDAFVGPKR